MAIARKKTTVYLDPDLLRAVKIKAAESGRYDYEVLETALRRYLGWEAVEAVWSRSTLSEDEALEIATSEMSMARAQHSPTGT
jgi:hypothetical protein